MAIDDNLISYYKLDEASGNAADSHGSNTGTSTSITYGVAGKINDCFSINNVGNVNMGDVAAFDGGHLTINLWCKTGSVDANDIIATKRIGGSGYTCQDDGSGKFKFQYEVSTTEISLISTTSISTSDVWQMVTFTYDGTTARLYINGSQEDSSTAVSGNLVATSADFRLGSHSAGASNFWDGEIDEVFVGSEAITSTDITNLYSSGNGWAYPFITNPPIQINIGDSWKQTTALKINIGDVWKDVAAVKQNIGDTWKDVF